MRIRVLGAAAGGGFPQWNANSAACRRARAGDPEARSATQASIALTADNERWVIVNASPDLRQQIEATPELHPRRGLRSSPIALVVLTNGDVDAIAGLLHLREGTAFGLLAAPRVLSILDRNPVFEVLDRGLVPRGSLAMGSRRTLLDVTGRDLGLAVVPFPAPGKVPLYMEEEAEPVTDAVAGDTIGLEILDASAGKRIVYLANCAVISEEMRRRVRGADVLFMDGTLWEDEEMIMAGVGRKSGRRMGHVSMSGPEGAVERLADLPIRRRIFIHINNTNPAHLADSDERAALERAGWEVAFDGMEVTP